MTITTKLEHWVVTIKLTDQDEEFHIRFHREDKARAFLKYLSFGDLKYSENIEYTMVQRVPEKTIFEHNKYCTGQGDHLCRTFCVGFDVSDEEYEALTHQDEAEQ